MREGDSTRDNNSTQILLLTQDPGGTRAWKSLIYLFLCRHHSKRKYLMKLITLMVENWIWGYLIPGSWWSGHTTVKAGRPARRLSELCFTLQSMHPRIQRALILLRCCLLPLLLEVGSRVWKLYETRAGRQRSSGHRKCTERTVGAWNPPDCGSLLPTTRWFFFSACGLDVWVFSWWAAQLENWETVHTALILKVLIWERKPHVMSSGRYGQEGGRKLRLWCGAALLVESVYWSQTFLLQTQIVPSPHHLRASKSIR